MSAHKVRISWNNHNEDLAYSKYDRTHLWEFEGGTVIKASAAVEFLGRPELVNPEEAFVAALSSCHMLTFLAIASRKHLVVLSYSDDAVGYLQKNEHGKLAVTHVVLDPQITFSDQTHPGKEAIMAMHELSHKECFIANSVLTEVTIKKENTN